MCHVCEPKRLHVPTTRILYPQEVASGESTAEAAGSQGRKGTYLFCSVFSLALFAFFLTTSMFLLLF